MSAQPESTTPPPSDGRLPRNATNELGAAPFGVYVHIPFCQTRCGYCDFNTYTALELGNSVNRATYADTVVSELRLARHVLGDKAPPVSTVFFGGGTPTLLPAEHLGLIVKEIDQLFGLLPGAEVTTEANPESVTPSYFERLRAAGFTRVSLGMQSAVPKILEILDRKHTPGRVREAVGEARAAGFEHINLDLIYGVPYETEQDWQATLDAAIAASPDHVSAYALIVEEGTALARQIAHGVVPAPEDDIQADRYSQADQALAEAGYQWYEVSNWARSAEAVCRHNTLYWTGANWWGAGPGAHSHVNGVRWWNVKHPARYAAMLESGTSPAAGREVVSPQARYMEKVMLAVRLGEGLSLLDLDEIGQAKAQQLLSWGLVEAGALEVGRLVLTQRGRLMADAVARELVPG